MIDVLTIILYVLGSILLVVLIILGIKMIITMNKIEIVVDDINKIQLKGCALKKIYKALYDLNLINEKIDKIKKITVVLKAKQQITNLGKLK